LQPCLFHLAHLSLFYKDAQDVHCAEVFKVRFYQILRSLNRVS